MIRSTTALIIMATVAGVAGAQGGAPANSRGSAYGTIEEVTVTARKREESLQDTPIAITAVTGAELQQRNLTNLMEVGAHVPNVFTTTSPGSSGAGNNAQIYIRGIGQTDFLFTTDPGVGIYVDGVYHPRTVGGVMDLLDLERVEVLRGPQGTLFGKNTIGGALNLVSNKPTGEPGGFGEVTLGRFDRLDIRGGYDFSVIKDKLFAKVSFSSKDRDGYGKRRDFTTGEITDEMGNVNATSARGSLRWLVTDDITADLSLDYTREREKSLPVVLTQFEPGAPLAGFWNALVATPEPMSTAFISDEYTSFGTGPNVNNLDAGGVGLTIEWDLVNGMTLKSVTAYREMEAAFGRDGDGSPNEYVHTDQDQEQDQISQELQLSGAGFNDRLQWMAGLFYFDEHNQETNAVRLASGLYDALEALPGAVIPLSPLPCPSFCVGGAGNPLNAAFDIDFDVYNEIDISSYAVFGQGTFDITDKLSLTAGIRWSYEEKIYSLEHFRANAGVPTVPATTVEDNWSSVTPMGSIDYRWSEELMTYVTVSEGFKSGGFNGRPTVASAVEAFDPETVLAYEIGAKTEWFDRRLRLNVAAFFNDYTDIQLGSIGADATGNLVLRIQNAGKAEVMGFELEMQARPMAGLDINTSVGYIDFEFTELDPGVQDITLDTRQPKTPEWTASAGAQYSWPVGAAGEATLRGDWSYVSDFTNDVLNTPILTQEGYSMFSARLVYEHLQSGWELALFGTNLGDERYLVGGAATLTSFGHVESVYAPPREWGLSLKKTF